MIPWESAQDYLLAVAFLALPAATAQLAGRFTDHEAWRPVARTLEWLTLLAGLGLAAVTYVALPGRGVMIGVAERGLLLVEFALVGGGGLAAGASRAHDRDHYSSGSGPSAGVAPRCKTPRPRR